MVNSIIQDPRGFLSRRHSAELCACCVRTLDGYPLTKYRVNKKVYYKRTDLEAFMAQHAEAPKSEGKRGVNPLADLVRDVARSMAQKQKRSGANQTK